MKIRNINCPNCNANISISDSGFNKCPFCSHEIYAEEKKDGKIIVNTTINRYTNYEAKKRDKSSGVNLKGSLILVVLIAVLSYALYTIFFTGATLSFPDKKEFKKSFNQSVQSSQMIRFVEVAFQKNLSEIQRSDYEKIKLIKFHYKNRNDGDFQIEYQLDDGTTGSVKYIEPSFTKQYIPLSDFQCFTNLEVLDFNNSNQIERYYSHNDSEFVNGLNNLEHLTKFGGQLYFNLEDIPDIIHDPSKLTYVSGSLLNNNLAAKTIPLLTNLEEIKIDYINDEVTTALAEFSKLEKLRVVSTRLINDNSYLNAILNLKELYLSSSSDIKNYQFLNGFPNLEKLAIDDALELRGIDFVSGMPKLQSLTLNRSIVKDLKPLANNEMMKELHLWENSELKDYSVIGTLKNLESLEVSHWGINNQINFPQLSDLTNLKELDIEQRLLRRVKLPQSIVSLSVNVPLADEFDLGFIPKLDNLKDLNLDNSGYLVNARAIHAFPKLESLTFNQSRLWKFDLSEILNSKTLKTVKLYDVMSFSLKPSSIKDNNVLETLYMNDIDNVYVFQGSINDFDTQKLLLGEVSMIFSNLHALKDLTLIDCDIEDLSFAQGTKELQHLDLTKNYVSDISPLTELGKLELAILSENPVANAHLLGKKIYMAE